MGEMNNLGADVNAAFPPIKLSQYADDTTLILDGSQDTLETSLNVIEKFSKISGLRLNNKKT